jgi:hypothetical protein
MRPAPSACARCCTTLGQRIGGHIPVAFLTDTGGGAQDRESKFPIMMGHQERDPSVIDVTSM